MNKKNKYLPSPEQIQASCQQLQKQWTERDMQKRRVIKHKSWTPPIIIVPKEYIDIDQPSDM